ncbi:long-chain fatty acid transporter permease [Flammeovirga pectinis]|uniref:Long-chain fatty acid transporter permease n=1 Tax=Flammeovirga pectinis TaxID=2494373 RepID=A0A3Q9FQC4_9BACT|nr:outer membrane protein transport protein [Flammeovirga pectinis]AZQ63594.1 long-chain fatty acid transporter permease [Flammeovirga pectinis]
MKIRNLLLTVATVFIANAAFANGFQVLLQGTKQIGRGNVGVGYGPDASSLFFNPGALSFLESSTIQVGVSPVMSNISYRGIDGSTKYASNSPMGTPFQAYGVYRPSAESPWAFGLGVFTPFGSTVTYDNEWTGKYSLQEISLQSIYIQPTVSYRINDMISVGGGLDIVTGGVQFKKAVAAPGGDVGFEMDGNTLQFGFNLGVFAQISEKFSAGINYRSGVDMKVEGGDATFDVPNDFIGSQLFGDAYTPGEQMKAKFNATLPLPSTIALGVGYNATDKLSFGLDFNYVTWSVYEELKVEFPDGEYGTISYDRKWENSYIINFGAEYKVTDAFTARAGAYYDTTPVPDGHLTPESPDANALGLSCGVSYMFSEKFGVDAAFLFTNKEQRENIIPEGVDTGGMNGVYKASAYIPSLSLNYNF